MVGVTIPAAVAGAAFLVWTIAVAVDDNDKDVFPPILPAAIAIAAFVLAVVLVYLGRSGLAFAMTALGTVSVVVTLSSLYPASTVMLARLFLAERLTGRQTVGVGCALVAVLLIVRHS